MAANPRMELPFPAAPPRASAAAPRGARLGRHAGGRAPAPSRPSRLLCLDVETVPDAALVPPDWPPEKFLKPGWHKIAAISFAEARIEVGEGGSERYLIEHCRSGGRPDWDEEQLLRGFWRKFSEGDFRIVTWNGRRFDLPVLVMRAFLYGIPAAAYFLRGDRWSGYTKRYAHEFHGDLAELLSSYGSAVPMGLDEMARAMGLPGKGSDHGSMVEALAAAGEIERIRAYCEGDVLNTLALYYRWAHVSGASAVEDHDASMASLADYLARERDDRPHLGAFLDSWTASTRPAPMLLQARGRPTPSTAAERQGEAGMPERGHPGP